MWRDYVLMHEGYSRRRSYAWEHTRAILYGYCAVNRDPKKSFPSIQQFMPLLTDSEVDEQTEGKRLQARMDEYKRKKLEQRKTAEIKSN